MTKKRRAAPELDSTGMVKKTIKHGKVVASEAEDLSLQLRCRHPSMQQHLQGSAYLFAQHWDLHAEIFASISDGVRFEGAPGAQVLQGPCLQALQVAATSVDTYHSISGRPRMAPKFGHE